MKKSSNAKITMAKDTLLYLPARIIEGVVGFITVLLFTKYFTEEAYGDYTFIQSTANFIYVVIASWLFHSCFRFVSACETEEEKTEFYSTVLRVWLFLIAGATAVALVILLCSFTVSSTAILYILPILAILISYSTVTMLYGISAALRAIKLNAFTTIAAITAKLLVTTAVVYIFPPSKESHLTALAVIFLVDTIASIVMFMNLKLYKYMDLHVFSKDLLRKLIRFGLPFIGLGITVPLLNVSDRFVIRAIDGARDLAIYTANYSIASAVFTILPIAIMRGVYPTILKEWKKDKEHACYLLSQSIRYFLLIAIPAAVGLSVLAPDIAANLGKPSYMQGSIIIGLVAFGMLFQGTADFVNKSFELTTKTRAIFTNSLIASVFNIVANIIAVPIWGYISAAVTTLISLILLFILSFVRGKRVLDWKFPVASCIKISIASAAMGISVYFLSKLFSSSFISLGILTIFGGIVYVVVLYLTGDIKEETSFVIKKLKERKA